MTRIICDVCADIPYEIAVERDITMMPMHLTVNGEDKIYCAETFDAKAFYDGMRNGDMCSTSQISTAEYKDFFYKFLSVGEDVIYVCLSSGLSGSYSCSLIAIDELKKEFPDRKIHSVDSLGASLGEGLLTLALAKMRDSGCSFEEIVDWAEEYKHNVMLWFTVDDLKYLKEAAEYRQQVL